MGEVARGFLNTYTSCRTKILTELLPRGYEYLRKQHLEFTEQMGQGKGHAIHPNRLTDEEIELYIVGHSLGGAVATLCAYDIACLTPHFNPVLVTFGSPPVGNIDFAIDFNKMMVERNEYHPRTRYLRSVRVVARTKDGKLDAVSAIPEKLPNYIHINSRVLIPSSAESRMGAHSMKDSYIDSLSRKGK